MKICNTHSYLKSLSLVCVTGLLLLFCFLSLLSRARAPSCSQLSFISQSNSKQLEEWRGKWYMQGSSLWFMNGFTDLHATSYLFNNQLVFEWQGFYSYLFMPSQFISRIRMDSGGNFSWDVVQPNLLKNIYPESRPVHVLAYEKDSHLIMYDCGNGWISGGLFALTRESNNSQQLETVHKIVYTLSNQYNIDSLFYSKIPHHELGILPYFQEASQNFWRVFLTLNTLHVLLSHLMPSHVTMLNSFSYTTLIHWNFGVHFFNIQTMLMYAYHRGFLAILSHSTIISDLVAWYIVLVKYSKDYFGPVPAAIILSSIIAFQIAQLISFRDKKFAFITSCVYIAFGILAFSFLEKYFYESCMVLIATGTFRMVGHIPELIPPVLSGEDAFKSLYNISFYKKLSSPIMMGVGIISESAAGMPSRGFPFIFYLVLCQFGYTSKNLVSLKECIELNQVVKKHGWSGSPIITKAVEAEHGWLFQ